VTVVGWQPPGWYGSGGVGAGNVTVEATHELDEDLYDDVVPVLFVASATVSNPPTTHKFRLQIIVAYLIERLPK